MFLQTSQDALNITKAVSLAVFVVFICWALFYFALILRDVYKMVKDVRGWIHKIDEILNILKEKIESSASYLLLIGEGMKKLVEILRDRDEKRGKRKKKTDES